MSKQKHLEEPPPLPDVPIQIECLYSPAEAGRYLRMTERMVYRRLDSGAIGHVKIGRTRYIKGAQILAFMSDNEVDPRPAHLRPRLGEV